MSAANRWLKPGLIHGLLKIKQDGWIRSFAVVAVNEELLIVSGGLSLLLTVT